ncbi:hypothetical protein Q3G72_032567 [Acer saccharum]|nr:hypothetical protein Q3G72_032567 [Acer saccharum]
MLYNLGIRGSKALLNFPDRIGSNEPEPVRVTTKRSAVSGLNSVESRKKRKGLAGQEAGLNVFRVGLMPLGEHLLILSTTNQVSRPISSTNGGHRHHRKRSIVTSFRNEKALPPPLWRRSTLLAILYGGGISIVGDPASSIVEEVMTFSLKKRGGAASSSSLQRNSFGQY